MKQWFKFAIIQDGIREGVELVKAESAEDAKNILTKDLADYSYTDDVEAYELREEPLTMEQEKRCAHQDLVEIFQADNCTKAEAERFIKQGGEAIKVADWEQYAKDNDLRDEDGERITLDKVKEELDGHRVTADGVEYILLYVL